MILGWHGSCWLRLRARKTRDLSLMILYYEVVHMPWDGDSSDRRLDVDES